MAPARLAEIDHRAGSDGAFAGDRAEVAAHLPSVIGEANEIAVIVHGCWPRPAGRPRSLPKTRSGKIMRRLLRSIAKGETITQDTSTLENPAILEQLAEKL